MAKTKKTLPPELKRRAELHKQAHAQLKSNPAYQALSPKERFRHIATHLSKAKKG